MSTEKPRVRFCWECGRKLWGNGHVSATLKADGHERVMHKGCFEENKADFTEARVVSRSRRDPSQRRSPSRVNRSQIQALKQ